MLIEVALVVVLMAIILGPVLHLLASQRENPGERKCFLAGVDSAAECRIMRGSPG